MKHLSIITFVIALFLLACKKEELAPSTTLNQQVDTAAVLKYTGTFVNGPYGQVSGKAKIYQNKDSSFTLKLEDFTATNGPDLHVMVSKEAMPIHFQDLGKLQSTSGNQVYKISGKPNFADYKYISIHCVAYNHLFGSALLN